MIAILIRFVAQANAKCPELRLMRNPGHENGEAIASGSGYWVTWMSSTSSRNSSLELFRHAMYTSWFM